MSPAMVPVSTAHSPSDVEIQQWVQKRFGFVPHPFWISHCKELFLEGAESSQDVRRPWHECPPDKRTAIREAFLELGILDE